MSKKILFVLHDAERMGAPMVMLHFITWIKQNTDTEVTMLLKSGGALQHEFEKLGKIYSWRPGLPSPALGIRIATALRRRLGKGDLYIPYPEALKKQKFDLVYLNTADTLSLAPMLKAYYGCPVFAHIHELSYSLQAFFPDALSAQHTAVIDHFIAASKSVKENLVTNVRIDTEKVAVFNEFIRVGEITKPTMASASMKHMLGIESCFVVGAAGQTGWRKGTDIFMQVARQVNRLVPENDIRFIWVGSQTAETKAQVDYEIEKLGLQHKVLFTGSKTSPQDYFQIFDLFLLTSREDPFPLVALEAAALQKPIFCFKNTGGIPEIIGPQIGKTFDYGDVDSMAKGIIDAYQHEEALSKQGKKAAEMAQQFDVDVIAPQLFNFISR